MSERLQRATGGFKPFNWLAGRSIRKEYWIYVGAFVAFTGLLRCSAWSSAKLAGLAS